ncbi:nuclear pore complex protein NUP88-like [Primulina tabacum]|uniref:nuclear pore complex protein NUP88-like n=1 Tax=Primulina tabacum TaxID=48773 RepID=UPI003F5A178E
MRFSYELTETEDRQLVSPTPSGSTPKAELQWLPLQSHPIFPTATISAASAARTPTNLMAWDGASRLYVWDSHKKCLHWVSIRLGDPDPDSISAGFPSKVLQADVPVCFDVSKVSINRNGSALLLAGQDGLRVMYLYGRASREENTIICYLGGFDVSGEASGGDAQ